MHKVLKSELHEDRTCLTVLFTFHGEEFESKFFAPDKVKEQKAFIDSYGEQYEKDIEATRKAQGFEVIWPNGPK